MERTKQKIVVEKPDDRDKCVCCLSRHTAWPRRAVGLFQISFGKRLLCRSHAIEFNGQQLASVS